MQESAIVAMAGGEEAVPIHAVKAEALSTRARRARRARAALRDRAGLQGGGRPRGVLPDADGGIGRVLFGLGAADSAERGPLLFGKLAPALPAGIYRLADGVDEPALAALAFALGAYRFDRYRKPKDEHRRGSSCRTASMPPRSSASATASSWRATSSTRRPTISRRTTLRGAAEALAARHRRRASPSSTARRWSAASR